VLLGVIVAKDGVVDIKKPVVEEYSLRDKETV
jgi:hypothetical protein